MRTIALFLFFASFGLIAQEAEFRPGQLLIQLKNGTEAVPFIRKFQIETDLTIHEFKRLSKTANMYQIVFTDQNLDLNNTTEMLYRYEAIINVQKNHLITERETIPVDALFNDQWMHKNTGQTGGTADADIDTPDAWDITTGGVTTHDDTIVVCVIENVGVDIQHEDLIDNIWHNYAEIPDNGTDDDNNGYIDDYDGWNVALNNDLISDGSHGTRVAGMVGAKGNNTVGISGVNWDVKMMIVQGQNAGDEASVLSAYDYPLTMRKKYNESFGAEGAFVVATNASWGIDNGQASSFPLWCAMYDTLGAYGVLNIAATTNNNINVDTNGDMPTTCSSDYLIGVTMSDHNDDRANSGYGPINVDLAAPGSGVELTAPGDLYITTQGTSFASPCVAGAVALAYSAPCAEFISFAKADPAAAAIDMRNYILSTVDAVPFLFGEVGTGGRLNVKNAIDSIMSACNVSACNQPYNLHSEYFTDTSAKFVWDGFSNNYLFYIQEGANPIVEIPLNTEDSIEFDTLIPCVPYTVWVKSICGTDTSDFSFPVSFTSDGCCATPNLNFESNDVDLIELSWNDITYGTQYDIIYKDTNTTSWDTLYDVLSPLTFNNMDTCTTYEFQIKTICTDSTQGFGPSQLFSTLGCGACFEAVYCDVLDPNANSEWIDSVVIGSATSVTGSNNGWYQSEEILTSVEPNGTYPIALKPGYSGSIFTERFTIWLDYNFNGVFESYEALIQNVTTTSEIVDNITIPDSALYGVTKMRIGMNGTSNPVQCPDNFWGEYEDYCIYIGEDAGISDNNSEVKIYPNPATDYLNILSTTAIISIKLYSQDGKLVMDKFMENDQIDVSTLNRGIYILHLQTEKGTIVQKFVKQ